MESDLAAHALSHGKGAKMRHMKEMHVKEMHTGGYHVTKHHGTHTTEHGAKDLDDVHDHMEEHMGEPNEGEEMAEGGTGSPAEEMQEGE